MTATHFPPDITAHTEAELELIKSEYEKLKSEQASRIRERDNFLYLAYAVMAIIAGAAIKMGSPLPLLAVAPAVGALGWKHLLYDGKVSGIRVYIRTRLRTRVYALTGITAFGWEDPAEATDTQRLRRRRLTLAADLMSFCVLPAAATAATSVLHGYTPITTAAAVLITVAAAADGSIIAVLAVQFITAGRQDASTDR